MPLKVGNISVVFWLKACRSLVSRFCQCRGITLAVFSQLGSRLMHRVLLTSKARSIWTGDWTCTPFVLLCSKLSHLFPSADGQRRELVGGSDSEPCGGEEGMYVEMLNFKDHYQ
ncbi:hypothetical protein MLD38_033058 [Melastoma candidum]|uniref:Uncharacterized protein n=1 Tax=Melastoma candidum TaxID=119954 RepID=A0ACB9M858_9MYRT|nr:hypothetical protein MLD38_033058 [Melastoma candidum]